MINENILKGVSKILGQQTTSSYESTTVSSEAISEVAYIPYSETLYITFQSGSRYAYFGVDESEYENLINAGSIGKTFNYDIKGYHSYSRI